MRIITINQELKDKRFITFLAQKPEIYAIANNITKANEALEDIIHNLIIGEIKDGLKPLNLKEETINVKQIEKANSYHELQSGPEQILAFLNINKAEIINNAFKSERTNVTIKTAYKVIAKKRGINISEFLNAQLKQTLNLDY